MIKLIAAVSKNAVIGKKGALPWDFDEWKEDMGNFRASTSGMNVIMGKKTFDSIGRPLPKRRNFVITSSAEEMPGVEKVSSLVDGIALADKDKDTWIIGGASVYAEGLKYADELHLTEIPMVVEGDAKDLVYFPYVSSVQFRETSQVTLSEKKGLYVRVFSRV